jgi:serine/threonine protein kinase
MPFLSRVTQECDKTQSNGVSTMAVAAAMSRNVGRSNVCPIGPPGIVADRFQMLRRVAGGGMGTVYEARDLAMPSKGHVALKIIRSELASDPAMIAQFKHEVEMGKLVTHPNVCRTHDLGVYRVSIRPGQSIAMPFLTMEFVPVATMENRLEWSGPFTPAEALPLLAQIAEGVGAIHGAGIVHSDLKPGNVLLAPAAVPCAERVVIIDFGLAQRAETSDSGQAKARTRGTPDYMSPEQARGDDAGPASDIYSLGILMYRMLTGRLPFDGRDGAERMRKRLVEEPVPPSRFVPAIDNTWEAVILRCLSKNPAQRFGSAREIVTTLRAGG